jgi:ubiquinone/menaquinone biosynthesis C-methylase UbiE
MWEENAEAWTRLARMGCDIYRDFLNTPAFLAMLPEVRGLRGLDIGCGEGHNTRLLAQRGAEMTGVDIAPTFIRHAREAETGEPLGIAYYAASATALPFADACFDFATAIMSLMEMANQEAAIAETHRVLKPGGFFQFSIIHPCFGTRRWKWVFDETGERVAVECGDYFSPPQGEISEWLFGAAPAELRQSLRRFRTPRFFRTLSGWLNLLLDKGFALERFEEPFADEEAVRRCPHVADTRIVAYFLHVRCRKPA